jgi:TonB family protein
MKRSDSAFSIALCASLLVHATLGLLVLREKLAELQVQHTRVTRVDAGEIDLPDPDKAEASADETPATVIQPAPVPLPEFRPVAPPPPPPVAQKPKDTNDENLEWGEKNAKGFAITSAPGETPLSARKGMQDQSFASRDPEGPDRFPEEPSMSVVPPGQNGDGRKPQPDALAGKGTEGNPADLLNKPAAPTTPPPPPIPERTVIASADQPFSSPQTSGRSTSQMPSVERRSPAETNSPPGEQDDLANDPATGVETQILPIKRVDVIGIASNKPAYPDKVLALTQPPSVRIAPDRRDPLVESVLANAVTADVPRSPTIQAAMAAISVKPQSIEEMARLLGETDPMNGLVIVEAMTRPPGAEAVEGGEAALPEIARADRPDAAETQDAIVALAMDAPRLAEPAQQQQFEPVPPTPPTPEAVAAANTGPTGSAASATGGAPGPAVAAADPAPDTGLESDPFAKIPGVEFKSGKVEARSGRQIKPIRPRLTEAGMRDLLAQQFPTVLAKVRIDKTGKVVDVHILRGSGSEAVDMPVYRALWGWWFEPPTDKKGNPLEDVQLVAIHWG